MRCSAKGDLRDGAIISSLFHSGQLTSKTRRVHAKVSNAHRFSVPSPDGPCVFQGTMRPSRCADIWKCDLQAHHFETETFDCLRIRVSS